MVFSTKFAQEREFPIENEKSEHHLWILHIWIRLASKFSLKLTTLTFWAKFSQKRAFLIGNKKVNITTEICPGIWISVGTKFQLELIILTIRTKFGKKGYFWSKNKKVRPLLKLPIKARWRDNTFALQNFIRSNKYLQNFSLN